MRYAWLVLVAVIAVGCIELDIAEDHRCTMNADCSRGGIQGTCEAVGHCSFADPSCGPIARRYDELAGDYAGMCVSAE